MKQFKRFFVACVAACAVVAMVALCGCSSNESTYTPATKTPVVSKPTISEDGVLRVGVNSDDGNAPLAGTTGKQKTVGIDVDMAAAIADEMGLKLEIVNVGNNASTALSAGTVDIVMGVNKSDSSNTFWTSDAYLPTSTALFALSSSGLSTPQNAASTTIAVQVQTNSAWAVANEFDAATVTSSDSLKSAFEALSSNSVQYVAADAVSGTYLANSNGISVKPVALLQAASGYAVGVLDGNTQLKQAISTAISTITSNGTSTVIQKKWLGTVLDFSGLKVLSTTSTTNKTDSSSDSSATSSDSSSDSNSTSTSATGTTDSTDATTTTTTSDSTATTGTDATTTTSTTTTTTTTTTDGSATTATTTN